MVARKKKLLKFSYRLLFMLALLPPLVPLRLQRKFSTRWVFDLGNLKHSKSGSGRACKFTERLRSHYIQIKKLPILAVY
jgi:hypothetical protein